MGIPPRLGKEWVLYDKNHPFDTFYLNIYFFAFMFPNLSKKNLKYVDLFAQIYLFGEKIILKKGDYYIFILNLFPCSNIFF